MARLTPVQCCNVMLLHKVICYLYCENNKNVYEKRKKKSLLFVNFPFLKQLTSLLASALCLFVLLSGCNYDVQKLQAGF